MTLLVSNILDQARGRHPLFDTSRHPNKVVLQYLSAKVRDLHGKITRVDPEATRSDVVAALPLANHATGIALGEQRFVAEVVAFDASGNEYPVDLIPASHRLDVTTPVAAAWQIGNTLYLTSPASLWDRMVSIVAAVVLTPTTLASLGATIPLPDAAELALVELLAAFMAKRTPRDARAPALDAAVFAADARAAEENYLMDVANRLTGQIIQTRDIYRP